MHGVGRHSRLSSLLRAFQSLHAYLRSPEAPVEHEDLLLEWNLAEFNDSADPPYLRLEPKEPDSDAHQGVGEVYLYEVNYSALAGVIRTNHPLDITHLFISLDLAVNVARSRLKLEAGNSMQARSIVEFEHHCALAQLAQKVTGVLTAATVPVLGFPSILLRRHVAPFVSDFTRFFEDVATFALDRNGEALISSHVDHTIAAVIATADQVMHHRTGRPYEFVVVAHSLGSVVMHSYLVKHWERCRNLPNRILTLGSPIALVCWLWRLLDFKAMKFDAETQQDDPYFCWNPHDPPTGAVGQSIEWTNIVSHLDPIATAFSRSDLYLSMPEHQIRSRLHGGDISHHFIDTGGLFSIGAAHTRYFDDKKNVIGILGKVIGLRGGWIEPEARRSATHWREASRHLLVWQVGCFVAGAVCLYGYFRLLGHLCDAPVPYVLMAVYGVPPWLIAYLAFWQRLLFGGPTKRTRPKTIHTLPLFDRFSFPYRLRQEILRTPQPRLEKSRPTLIQKYLKHVVSFLPTFCIMTGPILLMNGWTGLDEFLRNDWKFILPLLALFMAYTLLFGASELARHWRASLKLVALTKHPAPNHWVSPYRWVCHKCPHVNEVGTSVCAACDFPAVATAQRIARATAPV